MDYASPGLFDLNHNDSNHNDSNHRDSSSPLAYRVRPTCFNDFKGQDHLFIKYPFLKSGSFPSLILHGPPGTGKTTLAYILAEVSGKEIYRFSAVLGGVNDLRKLINSAIEMKKHFQKESIIFIDEIHRFNKAQQDALLPYVEDGSFILIGATTENPRVSVNRALLSRVKTIELTRLNKNDLQKILTKTRDDLNLNIGEDIIEFLANYSNGDARNALNIFEIIEKEIKAGKELSLDQVKHLVTNGGRDYDKMGNRHYDVISALIKSMRGNDSQNACLWLAVMIEGGEDPVFIARRLVIFASEDVGNADPGALSLATATLIAVQNIGMPEARINLAQAVTYLASTAKSRSSYVALNRALDYVKERDTIIVPDHLRNKSME